MRKIYFRFRIFLAAFTFGLASVFMISDSLQTFGEIFVDMPQVSSDSPIYVFPIEEKYIGDVGAGSGGITKCKKNLLSDEEMKKINRLSQDTK